VDASAPLLIFILIKIFNYYGIMNIATVKGAEYFMNSTIVSRIFNINLIFKRGRNIHKKLKGGYRKPPFLRFWILTYGTIAPSVDFVFAFLYI
jgi:hypothetical protein